MVTIMYSEKEIFGVESVKGNINKRTAVIVFSDSDKSQDVAIKVNQIIEEVRVLPGVPDFTTVLTTHSDEDDTVESIKLTIKTRKSDRIAGNNLRETAVIPFRDDFKELVINFIAKWVDEYNMIKKAQQNIDELNELVEPMCGAVKISFAFGHNIVESITNDSIVLGLDAYDASKIPTLDLFDSIDSIRNFRRGQFEEFIQSFTKPHDVIKSKNYVLQAFDLYTRSNVSSVLKRTYKKTIARDIKDRDICRFEFKDPVDNIKYFGLVEKVKDSCLSAEEKPLVQKDGYSYFVVLSPFGKDSNGFKVLSDSDAAAVIETII